MGAEGDNAEEPLLVGVDVVARLVSLSKRTIWRLVSAGKFPSPLQLGRSARWPYEQIKTWINQGCPPQSDSDV